MSPSLFDSLDQYIDELKTGTAFVDNVVPPTSPVLSFTENAFAQFFENEVGTEITGFEFKFKLKAARLRRSKKAQLSKQARALVALFEQFCDIHGDVLGAGYGGQRSVLEEFHTKLIVRLLERLRALAGVKRDDELRQRADSSLGEFKAAIKDHAWG